MVANCWFSCRSSSWRSILSWQAISHTLAFPQSKPYANSRVAFLVTDNYIFNGPLGRLQHSFAHTAHSRVILLTSLVHSLHSLTSSICSLHFGTIENFQFVYTVKTRLTEMIAFVIIIGKTPSNSHSCQRSYWSMLELKQHSHKYCNKCHA